MSGFDLLINGGLVVDGTGLARRRLDVGIRDGKVAAFGRLEGSAARETIDAKGMVVAPGVVDIHTHYDPQITFDPFATMSCFHGVTTVVAGNCGFSVAPCKVEDRPFLSGVFAQVENMDPAVLDGVAWDEFETFPQFLQSRGGRLGVNLACYVGHTNLRRWVMGRAASERAATEIEIDAMCKILAEALEAGAAGFSSSAAPTHVDLDDRPVPSRLAGREELLRLGAEAGRHGLGSITYLPYSAVGGLNDSDEDLAIELARVSRLPVIIQGLGGRSKVDAPTATWDRAQRFLDRAAARGAPVYSLLLSRPFDRVYTLSESTKHYLAVPSWSRMMTLPLTDRMVMLRDTRERDALRYAVENYNRDPEKGTTLPPPPWDQVYVDSVAKEENSRYQSRAVMEIAASEGRAPGDVVLDLALAEDFKTAFRWRVESSDWTAAVREAQLDERMIIGTSDGGAHLARDDGSDWPAYFLRYWVRERKVWSLEEGIRQITHVPASLAGLTDRGLLRRGAWADIMIFDPEKIGPLRKEFVRDLPGGAGRFRALSEGVYATIVNGEPIVLDGKLTGRLPGAVLRPG